MKENIWMILYLMRFLNLRRSNKMPVHVHPQIMNPIGQERVR